MLDAASLMLDKEEFEVPVRSSWHYPVGGIQASPASPRGNCKVSFPLSLAEKTLNCTSSFGQRLEDQPPLTQQYYLIRGFKVAPTHRDGRLAIGWTSLNHNQREGCGRGCNLQFFALAFGWIRIALSKTFSYFYSTLCWPFGFSQSCFVSFLSTLSPVPGPGDMGGNKRPVESSSKLQGY